MFYSIIKNRISFFLVLFVFGASIAAAQTTEFTYQGKITDTSGTAASYDFEFRLYDAAAGGALLGTQTSLGVPVANGVFTVQLDFGAQFSGAARFLDISVKPAGSANPFTPLAPRQPVTSAPYSIRSLNAATATNSTQLGGVAANQFVQTTDSRLSDARNPLPNSPNYIRNSTVPQTASLSITGSANFGGGGNFDGGLSVATNSGSFVVGGNSILQGNLTVNGTLTANLPSGDASYVQNRITQQSGTTNFNVSGNGTIGGTLSATTVSGNIFSGVIINSSVYRIGGENVLRNPGTRNIFVGVNTGGSGTDNSFFGFNAGNANLSTGIDNSFFGSDAGGVNTSGSGNSFFGSDTGDSNTTGFDNSFFGRSAGNGNTTGNSNSFFGRDAGLANTTADNNSFFGRNTGFANTSGSDNSFFGRSAGSDNTTGFHNSFFGYQAGTNNLGGGNNAFFGYSTGDANTSGEQNSFFGSNAGGATTTGGFNTFIGRSAGTANTTGSNNTVIGTNANLGAGAQSYVTVIGAGAVSYPSSNNTVFLGRSQDHVRIEGAATIQGGLIVGFGPNLGNLFAADNAQIGGELRVGGNLIVEGDIIEQRSRAVSKIDHPLDPKNKYLYHSFVESPEMMNIYNGNITTDQTGEAIVTMPSYFEALNRDFRYQLTVIGTFAQAVVAGEISDNQFKIRTDKPGVKVSWQVTGVRKNSSAEQNQIQTEVEKPEKERGTYLYPKAYERKIESAKP